MAIGTKATPEEHARRKSICEACPEQDSRGVKLFREHKPGRHSCGEARLDWIFRDPEVDGCGCWLELKWHGKDQKCPLKTPRW
jgi:hypothetical protein